MSRPTNRCSRYATLRLGLVVSLGTPFLVACDIPEVTHLSPIEKSCHSTEMEKSAETYSECVKAAPIQMRSNLCTKTIDGKGVFLGIPGCYETLLQVQVSGYWLTGFELSQFYSDLKSIQPQTGYGGTGFRLSDEAEKQVKPYLPLHTARILEVSFLGAVAPVPGIYDVVDDKVTFVSRFLMIKDVTSQYFGAR